MLAYYLRILRDRRPLPGVSDADRRVHLDAAADWLMRAFEADGSGGVPHSYNLRKRAWDKPYPETTGYIIPTFLDYARFSGRTEFRTAALRMARWEADILCADGGVQSGVYDPARPNPPTIFNTGQVLFGFVRAFEETRDEFFLDALRRSADWLVAAQDDDGAWRRFPSPFAKPGTNPYNTRTAFGLARAFEATQDERYLRSAVRNVEWAAAQAEPDAWIEGNCLTDHDGDGDKALTHTIAYTMRGILEVGHIASRPDFIELALRIGDAVARSQRDEGSLPGYLARGWRPAAAWSCLTGNVQFAINWQRADALTGRGAHRSHADAAIRYTMATQDMGSKDDGVRGGIKGSHPVDGEYMTGRYPNWAAKFFVDALLLAIQGASCKINVGS
jgi:hypothetical protein